VVHTIHAKVNTKQHASTQDTAYRGLKVESESETRESESESSVKVKGESERRKFG
jgi:hypothetical protein